MPDYTTDLTDEALTELLEDAPIHVQSLGDLAHLAARLEPLGEWVHTMEVNEVGGKGRIDFAIMGLDGEEEWEIPLEPDRMRSLLDTKIAAMRAHGGAFTFDLWMGETAE